MYEAPTYQEQELSTSLPSRTSVDEPLPAEEVHGARENPHDIAYDLIRYLLKDGETLHRDAVLDHCADETERIFDDWCELFGVPAEVPCGVMKKAGTLCFIEV